MKKVLFLTRRADALAGHGRLRVTVRANDFPS